VAVFVPGTPSRQSGSLYFITEDRTKAVKIPAAAAMKYLKRHGLGSNAPLCGQSDHPATTALNKTTNI
jgi:uncharacterized membrane protein